VHIETKKKISAADARKLLASAPGRDVLDERRDGVIRPGDRSERQDATFVGRSARHPRHPRAWTWVVSRNIRKGAALNSIQIGPRC